VGGCKFIINIDAQQLYIYNIIIIFFQEVYAQTNSIEINKQNIYNKNCKQW